MDAARGTFFAPRDRTRRTVKVLYRTRPHAPSDGGGDYLQLQRTLAPLQQLGVETVVSNDPALDLTPFDLVHLYGLGDARGLPRTLSQARAYGKRIVTTPIYWRHDALIAARKQPARYPEYALDALPTDAQARIRRVQQLEEELYDRAQKWALDFSEVVLPQSKAEGMQLTENFGVAPEKIRVAPNAAEASYATGNAERFFRRYGVRDFVLCIARFQAYKNQMNLLRAWKGEPTPLVLVGTPADTGYFEWCKKTASANVIFAGVLSPAEVADACAAAKVHVLTSWYEVVGMAALEAALAGCNIVMTQESPAREYLGDACFLCDPDSPASIRGAIRAALDAPRSDAPARQVRERVSWQTTAQITADAYVECLAHPAQVWDERYRAQLEQFTATLSELDALHQPWFDEMERELSKQQAWEQSLRTRYDALERERVAASQLPLMRWLRSTKPIPPKS